MDGFKTIKSAVGKVLFEHTESRDDYVTLYALYCKSVKIKDEYLDLNKISVHDFLMLVKQRKIASFDVVSRARRQLQKNIPSIRGTKWEERHGIKVDKALHSLGYQPKHRVQTSL